MNLLKNITKKIDLPSLPANTQKEVKFSFSIVKDWVTYFTDVLNTVIDFLNTYIARVDDTSIAHIISTVAHGATGAVVGTTNTQTILNKTLTSPKINNIVSTTSAGILLESNTGTDIVLFGDSSSDDTIFYGNVIAPTAEFGSSTNKTIFESDGTMIAQGDATTWNDINISMNSMANTGATILDILTIGGNKFKAFIGTGAATQQVDGSLEILHDYKEGSDITPHIHWMPEDANTGNVKFSLGYRWWNGGSVMPAETVITVTIAAGGVQYQEKRNNFTTISGAGMTMGSRFVFRIFRDPTDAADTYTHYAIGLDFGIHYEKDTIGSRQITSK